jgi:hypothetical protein
VPQSGFIAIPPATMTICDPLSNKQEDSRAGIRALEPGKKCQPILIKTTVRTSPTYRGSVPTGLSRTATIPIGAEATSTVRGLLILTTLLFSPRIGVRQKYLQTSMQMVTLTYPIMPFLPVN